MSRRGFRSGSPLLPIVLGMTLVTAVEGVAQTCCETLAGLPAVCVDSLTGDCASSVVSAVSGAVCDGVSGRCGPERTGVSACCAGAGGCFEGPGTDVLCPALGGTLRLGEACLLPSGTCGAPCTGPGIDPAACVRHFQCFELKPGTPQVTLPNVTLRDRFGQQTVGLRLPDRICAPANKRGEDPTAPADPEHLMAYPVLPRPVVAMRNLVVSDQFGTKVLDTVSLRRLLVPAAKSLSAPPAPLSAPIRTDHFACYKVRPSRGLGTTARFRRVLGVQVQDQFGMRVVDVIKPALLCVPTDKNGEAPAAPTHEALLQCYRTRPSGTPFSAVSPIFTTDQLHGWIVRATRTEELCVPAVSGTSIPTTTSSSTVPPTSTSSSSTATSPPTTTTSSTVAPTTTTQPGASTTSSTTTSQPGASTTSTTLPCTTSTDCSDGNPCTDDLCVAAQCTHTPTICDDQNICTIDFCDASAGGCVFAPKSCDDANPCTLDGCNPLLGGCVSMPSPIGTVCRSAAGACDVAEMCVGVDCPPDALAPSGTVCRSAAGACDIAEMCDGLNVDCPPDVSVPQSTVCRSAAGVCDVAETCDGIDPGCPPDAFLPSGIVCRPAVDDFCDVAEMCTGASVQCPSNNIRPVGLPCMDDGDPCTADACDATGQCAHTPIPGCSPCLGEDNGCDDLNPCTVDSCLDGLCQHEFVGPGICLTVPGDLPCLSDADCDSFPGSGDGVCNCAQ